MRKTRKVPPSDFVWDVDSISVSLDAGPIVEDAVIKFCKSLHVDFVLDLGTCFSEVDPEQKIYDGCAGFIVHSKETDGIMWLSEDEVSLGSPMSIGDALSDKKIQGMLDYDPNEEGYEEDVDRVAGNLDKIAGLFASAAAKLRSQGGAV